MNNAMPFSDVSSSQAEANGMWFNVKNSLSFEKQGRGEVCLADENESDAWFSHVENTSSGDSPSFASYSTDSCDDDTYHKEGHGSVITSDFAKGQLWCAQMLKKSASSDLFDIEEDSDVEYAEKSSVSSSTIERTREGDVWCSSVKRSASTFSFEDVDEYEEEEDTCFLDDESDDRTKEELPKVVIKEEKVWRMQVGKNSGLSGVHDFPAEGNTWSTDIDDDEYNECLNSVMSDEENLEKNAVFSSEEKAKKNKKATFSSALGLALLDSSDSDEKLDTIFTIDIQTRTNKETNSVTSRSPKAVLDSIFTIDSTTGANKDTESLPLSPKEFLDSIFTIESTAETNKEPNSLPSTPKGSSQGGIPFNAASDGKSDRKEYREKVANDTERTLNKKTTTTEVAQEGEKQNNNSPVSGDKSPKQNLDDVHRPEATSPKLDPPIASVLNTCNRKEDKFDKGMEVTSSICQERQQAIPSKSTNKESKSESSPKLNPAPSGSKHDPPTSQNKPRKNEHHTTTSQHDPPGQHVDIGTDQYEVDLADKWMNEFLRSTYLDKLDDGNKIPKNLPLNHSMEYGDARDAPIPVRSWSHSQKDQSFPPSPPWAKFGPNDRSSVNPKRTKEDEDLFSIDCFQAGGSVSSDSGVDIPENGSGDFATANEDAAFSKDRRLQIRERRLSRRLSVKHPFQETGNGANVPRSRLHKETSDSYDNGIFVGIKENVSRFEIPSPRSLKPISLEPEPMYNSAATPESPRQNKIDGNRPSPRAGRTKGIPDKRKGTISDQEASRVSRYGMEPGSLSLQAKSFDWKHTSNGHQARRSSMQRDMSLPKAQSFDAKQNVKTRQANRLMTNSFDGKQSAKIHQARATRQRDTDYVGSMRLTSRMNQPGQPRRVTKQHDSMHLTRSTTFAKGEVCIDTPLLLRRQRNLVNRPPLPKGSNGPHHSSGLQQNIGRRDGYNKKGRTNGFMSSENRGPQKIGQSPSRTHHQSPVKSAGRYANPADCKQTEKSLQKANCCHMENYNITLGNPTMRDSDGGVSKYDTEIGKALQDTWYSKHRQDRINGAKQHRARVKNHHGSMNSIGSSVTSADNATLNSDDNDDSVQIMKSFGGEGRSIEPSDSCTYTYKYDSSVATMSFDDTIQPSSTGLTSSTTWTSSTAGTNNSSSAASSSTTDLSSIPAEVNRRSERMKMAGRNHYRRWRKNPVIMPKHRGGSLLTMSTAVKN